MCLCCRFVPVSNYTLYIEHNNIPFSVSPLAVWKLARPAPTLTAATFDSSLARIHATFDYPTNMFGADNGSCAALLDSSLLLRLGALTSCFWSSASSLVVSLQSRARIEPDTILFEMKEIPLLSYMENSQAVNSSRLIGAPPSAVVPRIVLNGPARVGPCDSLRLTAALSYGGGSSGLTFQWQALQHMFQFVPGQNQMLASVVSSQTSSTLMLDPDALVVGREYTFRVTVHNLLGHSSTAEWSLHKVADVTLPLHMVNPRIETASDKPTLLTAVAQQPLHCDTTASRWGKRQVMFRWSLVNGSSIPGVDISSQQSSSVVLPATTLRTFGVYEFDVLAYLDGIPAINNTARVAVNVVPCEIYVGIEGGDRALCETSTAASLEAVTVDHSALDGNLTYAWSCDALSPTGEYLACPRSITMWHESYLNLIELSPGLYTIAVFVSQQSVDRSGLVFIRTATSTTALEVRAQSCSQAVLTRIHEQPWLHSQRLTLRGSVDSGMPTWQWYTDRFDVLDLHDADSTVTGASDANLVVRASRLQPGTRYTFFFLADTAPQHNRSSYAQAVVQVAEAPCCGTFAVAPQVGEALGTSFTLQTTAAQHADWSSSIELMPLSYVFAYKKEGKQYALSDLQLAQSVETFLPVGDVDRDFLLELTVTVSDIYKATTISESTATVNPLDESRSSAAFNQTLTAVEDSILLGSTQAVGLIMSICDVLNFVSSTSASATNSSGRRVLTADAGVAERLAIRERLAQAVVAVRPVTDDSVPSMLAVAAMLSSAPCELSTRAIDLLTPWLTSVISNAAVASVEAAMQGAAALDNLFQTRNCLADTYGEEGSADLNSSSSCDCHGRGECVDGTCQCASHTCIIAKCTLSRESRAPGCFQPNPLCDATDVDSACNRLTCEVGLCAPGNTSCFEGRCVPGADGLDCFLGTCPEVPLRWASPDCMYTKDAKRELHVLAERHNICSATDLHVSVQHLTQLAAAQRVANEADLDLALETFHLKVATLFSDDDVSGYVMQPASASSADGPDSSGVILPQQCHATGAGASKHVAGVIWNMNPFPFGLADTDQNSSYPTTRVVSLALSPCTVSDLHMDPFTVVLPRLYVPPELPTIVSSSCPTCSQHGRCDNGTCYCDQGYEGENCSSRVTANLGDSPALKIEECRYWNAGVNLWDDSGCSLVLTNSTHVFCECGFQPRLIAAFTTEWIPIIAEVNPFSREHLSAFAADAMSLPVLMVVCSVTLVYLALARAAFKVNRARQHQEMMQRVIQQRVAEKNGTRAFSNELRMAPGLKRPGRSVSAAVVPVNTGAKYLPEAQLDIVVRSSAGVRGRVASLLHPQWLCNELRNLGLARTYSYIWIDVWRERGFGGTDSVTRLQRLTVILVVVLSNVAMSVALFGVSRCKPKHRNECSQALNGCACSPQPEDISWSRIVLTAMAVSVLVLPCDRVLLGMWEIVEERKWDGADRGPGKRPWSMHDFATHHRAIILVQTAARAFIARNRVVLVRKLHSSQLNSHHAAMVAMAASAPPPPPLLSRRAALEEEMLNGGSQTGSATTKVWVRRRPFNGTVIDPQQIAFAALVGTEGRTAEEVVRGAVTIQRWFRRAALRRQTRWQDRVQASYRPTAAVGSAMMLDQFGNSGTEIAGSNDGAEQSYLAPLSPRSVPDQRPVACAPKPRPLKRWRRRERQQLAAGHGRASGMKKTLTLPPRFSWLIYCVSFLWSGGCGVYSIVAAAYYTNELTRAWAACLGLALALQMFVLCPLGGLLQQTLFAGGRSRHCEQTVAVQ